MMVESKLQFLTIGSNYINYTCAAITLAAHLELLVHGNKL